MSVRAGIRRALGSAYRRVMYLIAADFDFELALHPELTILSPSQWSGVEEPELHPGEVFFGYYDKTPWSSDMSRMILHERQGDGLLHIVVYDREARRKSVVASPGVWNWQQGSMTQWLAGGSKGEVLFNDLAEGRLVSRIVSVFDGSSRIVHWPVQCVHPGGDEAMALNYRRLESVQPEYGYGVGVTNFHAHSPLNADGIWRVDLDTGDAELGVSLDQLVESVPKGLADGARHAVNHFCYSRTGDDIVFLHRWTGRRGTFSRLYVADRKLSEVRLLLDDGMVSHYSWRDDRWVIAWARTVEHGDRYYLIDTRDGLCEVIGRDVLDSYGDGHPSFSSGGGSILTDTYPDKARQARLMLYDVARERLVELGRFRAPWSFDRAQRCDLHPRWSPDGQLVSIDSAHSGERRSYVLALGPLADLDGQ